ncbi:MAG: S-4TM family putative pore-forming effector [Acidimicrobiia bacterium]
MRARRPGPIFEPPPPDSGLSAIAQELGHDSTDPSGLRAFQDQIFQLRRAAPLVPDWFCRLRRSRLDADMRDAAEKMTQGEARG